MQRMAAGYNDPIFDFVNDSILGHQPTNGSKNWGSEFGDAAGLAFADESHHSCE